MGAFHLRELDRRLAGLWVQYFRYMDDILILAETRWKLKQAIRVLNRTLGDLKLPGGPSASSSPAGNPLRSNVPSVLVLGSLPC